MDDIMATKTLSVIRSGHAYMADRFDMLKYPVAIVLENELPFIARIPPPLPGAVRSMDLYRSLGTVVMAGIAAGTMYGARLPTTHLCANDYYLLRRIIGFVYDDDHQEVEAFIRSCTDSAVAIMKPPPVWGKILDLSDILMIEEYLDAAEAKQILLDSTREQRPSYVPPHTIG